MFVFRLFYGRFNEECFRPREAELQSGERVIWDQCEGLLSDRHSFHNPFFCGAVCNLPRTDDTANEISRICGDRVQVVVLFQAFSSVFVLDALRFGICGDNSSCVGSVDNCPSTQITVLLESPSHPSSPLCQQSVFHSFLSEV